MEEKKKKKKKKAITSSKKGMEIEIPVGGCVNARVTTVMSPIGQARGGITVQALISPHMLVHFEEMIAELRF